MSNGEGVPTHNELSEAAKGERRLSRLEATVEGLAGEVQQIASAVRDLASGFQTSQRTQWPVLISGIAVLITIGSLVVAPLFWLIIDTRSAGVERHREQEVLVLREMLAQSTALTDRMDFMLRPYDERVKKNADELARFWGMMLGSRGSDGMLYLLGRSDARLGSVEGDVAGFHADGADGHREPLSP